MKHLHNLDVILSLRLALAQTDPKWMWAARVAHSGDGEFVFGSLALAFIGGWFIESNFVQFAVLVTLFSLTLAAFSVTSIKYTVRRERPRDPTGFVSLSYDKYSFPSGHSARMSCLAGSVLLFSAPLGLILIIHAMLVALSRVAVTVHYLGDVVAGFSIGLVISLAVGAIIL